MGMSMGLRMRLGLARGPPGLPSFPSFPSPAAPLQSLRTQSSVSSAEAPLPVLGSLAGPLPGTLLSMPTSVLASLLSHRGEPAQSACPLQRLDQAQQGGMHHRRAPPAGLPLPAGLAADWPGMEVAGGAGLGPSAGALGMAAGLSRAQTLRALHNLLAQVEGKGAKETGSYQSRLPTEARGVLHPSRTESLVLLRGAPTSSDSVGSRSHGQHRPAALAVRPKPCRLKRQAEDEEVDSSRQEAKRRRGAKTGASQVNEELLRSSELPAIVFGTSSPQASGQEDSLPDVKPTSGSPQAVSDSTHDGRKLWPKLFGVTLVPCQVPDKAQPTTCRKLNWL